MSGSSAEEAEILLEAVLLLLLSEFVIFTRVGGWLLLVRITKTRSTLINPTSIFYLLFYNYVFLIIF